MIKFLLENGADHTKKNNNNEILDDIIYSINGNNKESNEILKYIPLYTKHIYRLFPDKESEKYDIEDVINNKTPKNAQDNRRRLLMIIENKCYDGITLLYYCITKFSDDENLILSIIKKTPRELINFRDKFSKRTLIELFFLNGVKREIIEKLIEKDPILLCRNGDPIVYRILSTKYVGDKEERSFFNKRDYGYFFGFNILTKEEYNFMLSLIKNLINFHGNFDYIKGSTYADLKTIDRYGRDKIRVAKYFSTNVENIELLRLLSVLFTIKLYELLLYLTY